MRSELSEVVTAPQVFEPGARAGLARDGDLCWIVSREADGVWWGWAPSGEEVRLIAVASVPSEFLRVIAPAPNVGHRWENEGRHRVAIVNTPMGDLVCKGDAWSTVCKGDAVTVARWLLEHGYNYADDALAPLRTSKAAPASELAPSPAPWTLTAARQFISATIGAASTRQPAAFTSALCSLAEHGAPSAKLITATAGALAALEAALPERGAVARWQVERAMWAVSERLRSELSPEQAILSLCACTVYLKRRGAW